jgi:hypothetical protein
MGCRSGQHSASDLRWGGLPQSRIDDEAVRRKVRELTAIRFYGTTAHPSCQTIERQYVKFGGASVFQLGVDRVASWDYDKLPVEQWIVPTNPPATRPRSGRPSEPRVSRD